MNNEPTIISLQDTIDLIIRKYGENWRDWAVCKATVIWTSTHFLEDHVKEIVPDLFDLCEEYRNKKTINGKEFSDNLAMLACAVIDPNYEVLPK